MKKIRSIFIVLAVITVLSTNLMTLFADGFINDIPWSPDLPAIGDMQACTYFYDSQWFTGSVKWVCTVQWVCPECTCTPEACGEVSVGHKY